MKVHRIPEPLKVKFDSESADFAPYLTNLEIFKEAHELFMIWMSVSTPTCQFLN